METAPRVLIADLPAPLLVTGASGQVGSYVMDALRAANLGAVGLDLIPSRWATIVGDVRTARAPDTTAAIVHCAAQVSVPRSFRDPRGDASTNIDGTIAALDMARQRDVSRFIYFSSAAVYGNTRAVPIAEDTSTKPLSPYGLSKLVGEHYTHLYASTYGIPTVVLRPFNIFSARQDPTSPYSGVISRFAERLSQGAPPVIFGDGLQTRDFVHASDVVQAVLRSLSSPAAVGQTFNVGTGIPTTVLDIAHAMIRLSAKPLMPCFESSREGEIRESVADISKIRSIGYRPDTTLKDHLLDVFQGATI